MARVFKAHVHLLTPSCICCHLVLITYWAMETYTKHKSLVSICWKETDPLSGSSLFLKTEGSALSKFGGKCRLVIVRRKRRCLEVFDRLFGQSLDHSKPVWDQEDSQIDGPFWPKILEFSDVVPCSPLLSGVLKSSIQGEINPDQRKDWTFKQFIDNTIILYWNGNALRF